MPRTEPVLGPGIGESQRRLLDLLKRSGECTLARLEAGFDLSRETLRTHLKSLVAMGLVERPGVHRKGPGRPHVPIQELVAVSDLPCRFEKRLVESLLGERSRRETFMVEGDHACTYAVGPLAQRRGRP